jgi:hypothetical protein
VRWWERSIEQLKRRGDVRRSSTEVISATLALHDATLMGVD